MADTLFINQFDKGSQENANLGLGTLLGVENYTTKGIARLTKDSFKVSGNVVTDLPIFTVAKDSDTYFIQGLTGKVYKYIVSTSTFTDISPSSLSGGRGLVFFDNVLYAFQATTIDYLKTPYNGGGAWVQGWQTGLNSVIHTAFIFPSAYGFYFCNGNKVGLVQEKVPGTLIDPASSSTYNYSDSILTLPPLYTTLSLSFLPPSQLMIGTGSQTDQTVADIIGWDTISLNKFSPPLRLFSQAPRGENGVTQLINRNNTLYAVTGGNHTIYSTNGSTFNQIADLSLFSNIRTTGGAQTQLPVFINAYPGAIDVFGNKLFTGVATPNSIAYYPANNGLYPAGVWSVAFGENTSIQCEYTISTNTTVAVKTFIIGTIKCIGANQTLIGWQDDNTFGVDLVSTTDFQNTIGSVAIESEMMEIGTPLDPDVIPNIQLNTPRQLKTGQSVAFNYRTGFDQDYVPLETFTVANNNDNGYKIVNNDIGPTRFLQLKVQMASTSDTKYSPEIRNIIISKG